MWAKPTLSFHSQSRFVTSDFDNQMTSVTDECYSRDPTTLTEFFNPAISIVMARQDDDGMDEEDDYAYGYDDDGDASDTSTLDPTQASDTRQPQTDTSQDDGLAALQPDCHRRVINQWSSEQRFALLALRDCYEMEWDEITKNMNLVFYESLDKQGFFQDDLPFQGIRTNALRAQYDELHRGKRQCGQAIRAVFASSDYLHDLPSPYREINRAIRYFATAAGITLKGSETIDKSKFAIKPAPSRLNRRRRHSSSTSSDSEIEVIYETDTTAKPPEAATPPRGRIPVAPSRQRLPVRQSRPRCSEVPSHNGKPNILFRVYHPTSSGTNSGQGFYSALQLRYEPPLEEDDILVQYGLPHLNRIEVGTPFILMTSSLMVAINKAKENGPGARIALINPHEIATMYYIPGICARVKATGQANFKNYKGDHEYWAWLQVPSRAIISDICAELITQRNQDKAVNDLVSLFEPGNYSSRCPKLCKEFVSKLSHREIGSALGSIAKSFFPVQVNPSYAEDLIRCSIYGLHFWTDTESWLENTELCQGLNNTLGLRLGLYITQRITTRESETPDPRPSGPAFDSRVVTPPPRLSTERDQDDSSSNSSWEVVRERQGSQTSALSSSVPQPRDSSHESLEPPQTPRHQIMQSPCAYPTPVTGKRPRRAADDSPYRSNRPGNARHRGRETARIDRFYRAALDVLTQGVGDVPMMHGALGSDNQSTASLPIRTQYRASPSPLTQHLATGTDALAQSLSARTSSPVIDLTQDDEDADPDRPLKTQDGEAILSDAGLIPSVRQPDPPIGTSGQTIAHELRQWMYGGQ